MTSFLLMLWGLTYLATSSVIFARVRTAIVPRVPLGQMVYCPSCTGFWIGLGLAALAGWPLSTVVHPLFDAAVSSAGLMAVPAYFMPSSAWDIEQGSKP